jgi:hypothetical protein
MYYGVSWKFSIRETFLVLLLLYKIDYADFRVQNSVISAQKSWPLLAANNQPQVGEA